MDYSQHKWPRPHRMLLAAVVVLLLLIGAVAYLFLYPAWVEYSTLVDEKSELEAKLQKAAWPKDQERLEATLKAFKKRLDKDNGNGKGMVAENLDIMSRATGMFREKIEYEYESIADFMQRASQTEYQDQYDRLDTYLQGKNLNLDSTVFGMNENTAEASKYQMLLKLWTVQAVVDCALNNKMSVVQRRLEANHGRLSAQITALPMKSYYVSEKDSSPYLMEFPVQIQVSGNVASFKAFVDALFSDGRFLPISQVEIVAGAPDIKKKPKHDSKGQFSLDNIAAQVVCSSFFMPGTPPKKAGKVISGTGAVIEKPAGI